MEHGAHGHHPITLHAVRVSFDTSEQGDGPALLRAGVMRVADAQQQLVLRQVDLDLHTRRPARRRVRQRYPRLRRTIRTVTRPHSAMPCQRRVNGGEARGVRAMSQSSPARGTCARPPTRPGASSGTTPRRIRSARGASAAPARGAHACSVVRDTVGRVPSTAGTISTGVGREHSIYGVCTPWTRGRAPSRERGASTGSPQHRPSARGPRTCRSMGRTYMDDRTPRLIRCVLAVPLCFSSVNSSAGPRIPVLVGHLERNRRRRRAAATWPEDQRLARRHHLLEHVLRR